jgi:integrase
MRAAAAMRIDFPYLMEDTDRHGNRRTFVRRFGRKVRIRVSRDAPAAFARAYSAALETLAGRVPAERGAVANLAAAGSLGALAADYFGSRKFMALDPASRQRRRQVIEECLREPPAPGARTRMADCPLDQVDASAVGMLMDRKTELPGAANNRKKHLSALLGWAVKQRRMRSNPARDAERISYATQGFHTWSVDEVRAFETCHAVGTKPRLALALLLFLGVRRGDMVTLGRQHVRDGVIRFVPRKTRYRRAVTSEKPVLPALAEIIAASPTGDLTFLVTSFGKPFTAAGFGNWFRAQCDAAGLPHCSAHGLRKAGATIAAENGATDRQLMALYDWTSAAQANTYTQAADRKRLAGEAARLLVGHFSAPPKKETA